jgi:hypothetical protein
VWSAAARVYLHVRVDNVNVRVDNVNKQGRTNKIKCEPKEPVRRILFIEKLLTLGRALSRLSVIEQDMARLLATVVLYLCTGDVVDA